MKVIPESYDSHAGFLLYNSQIYLGWVLGVAKLSGISDNLQLFSGFSGAFKKKSGVFMNFSRDFRSQYVNKSK
jgi:hypothetical protein